MGAVEPRLRKDPQPQGLSGLGSPSPLSGPSLNIEPRLLLLADPSPCLQCGGGGRGVMGAEPEIPLSPLLFPTPLILLLSPLPHAPGPAADKRPQGAFI